MENAWICTIGLVVQAELAERARAAGDAGTLRDAIAVGHMLLERAHTAVEQTRALHGVDLPAWHAKAEAEWTRVQGRSDPKAWLVAVEAFSYGHVYEVARCRWRLAEALLGGGDREQATMAAQAAHQTAVRLGAEPLRAALEALARRGRLDLGAGVPAERALAGLTPRELEVLRLLVEGRSNRQIAERLFISGKTASVHVTNILAKLGRAQPPGGRRHRPPSRPGPAGTGGLCDLTAEQPLARVCCVEAHTTDRATCRCPWLHAGTAASAPPKVKAPSFGDLGSSPHDWLDPLPLASGVEHPTGSREHRMSA